MESACSYKLNFEMNAKSSFVAKEGNCFLSEATHVEYSTKRVDYIMRKTKVNKCKNKNHKKFVKEVTFF